MLVRTPNPTTADKFHFKSFGIGETYFAMSDFSKDGRMTQSIEHNWPVAGPNEVLSYAYPTSALSTLTPVEGYDAGRQFMTYDEFAPTEERKQDVLSTGSRYLDEQNLVDCSIEECIIPVQLAYTGIIVDEQGNPVLEEDQYGEKHSNARTVIMSDLMEVKVTSVIQRKRPTSLNEDTAVIYNGIDPSLSPGNGLEKGWQGKVWYVPSAASSPYGVLNGANEVADYIEPNREYSMSFLGLLGSGTDNGKYSFGFGSQIESNNERDGIKADYKMAVDAVDEEGTVLEADGKNISKVGGSISVKNGFTRKFVISVKQDVSEPADWAISLTPRSMNLFADNTVALGNGASANLRVLSTYGDTAEIGVEIIGGPDSFILDPTLNGFTEEESEEFDQWSRNLFGFTFGQGTAGHSSDFLPGYELRNSEKRGVIDEVPTPDVPNTPEPEEPVIPEVPETPEPEEPATPDVPEVPETPSPEVPISETVVVEDEPVTDMSSGQNEGVTETGAEKPTGLLTGGLLALAAGIGTAATKLRNRIRRA
ncbi:MAG: hypothetical protein H9W81_09960 [Enterococcus sp.]|nr:hypothetical protein [Enterococcus sp.]